MRRLLRFSIHHPRIVLATAVAVSLTLGVFIPRVRLRLDARSLVPTGHPDLAASDASAALFNLNDVVVFAVAGGGDSGIYNPETLARIDRLSRGLARVDGVIPATVTSMTTDPVLLVSGGVIDARPLLAGGGQPDADTAERARREVKALGLNDGVLVAPDGRAAAILADISGETDRYLLLRRIKELTGSEASGEDWIYVSGTALAQAVLGEASARDLMRLIPLVILVLGAALTFAFRRPAPALISLTEIGTSLVWTVGLMGASGQSVFVTTLVLPVVLISVGVSDDVYVLKRYFSAPPGGPDESSEERALKTFGAMIWPVGLTTISTVVGLLSIAATGLEPLWVFGIFGSLAILFSGLFTFSLVPALLVLVEANVPRVSGPARLGGKGDGAPLFRALMTIGPRRILAVAAVVAAGAAVLSAGVRVDDSWIRNIPAASEVTRGDRAINELLAGTTTLELLVDSGMPDGFVQPQSVLKLISLEERLASLQWVGAIYGIHDDVLRVNASLREIDYSAYRASLLRGETQLSRGEIEQALTLLALTRRSPLSERIDDGRRRVRVTAFIRSADYGRIECVLQAASAAGGAFSADSGGITPFGDAWISYTTVRLLVEGQARSIALALLADAALLMLLFKSVRAGLIAIIPVAFSVLMVFASLALTETPLGIANSMFAGIAIGIGLDFAIHLTADYRRASSRGMSREEAMRHAVVGTGPAIITGATAITLGFSVLTLSEIGPNAQLGLMTCLSLTVCAVATLLLVPGIVLARRSTDYDG